MSKSTALDRKMRQAETYHNIRIPAGLWIILRVDGRSFTELTKRLKFEHPFDSRFHSAMRGGLVDSMEQMSGYFGTTHSDEASIALPPRYDLFDRSHEKLVSLVSSTFTASFLAALTWEMGSVQPPYPTFDARVLTLASFDDVVSYFNWRNMDSWRNCVNSTLYWTLRNEGLSARQADKVCRIPQAEKHELLHEKGINPAKLAGWQRNGSCVRTQVYEKQGYNPITKKTVTAHRRKLVIEDIEHGGKKQFHELLNSGPDWA